MKPIHEHFMNFGEQNKTIPVHTNSLFVHENNT